MFSRFAAFAFISFSATLSVARDIYVDNVSGDDRFTGAYQSETSTTGGPVRTIAKALRLADPGDRIVLANRGRAYHEAVSLVGSRHSGNMDRPFVFDGGGATLEGAAPVPHHAWEQVNDNVFRFKPDRLGLQQLFLFGKPAARRPTSKDGDLPPLEPLEWCLTRGHIYFRTEDGRTPQSYQPTCTVLESGVTLYKVRNVIVSNLVVQGFHTDGINAHDGSFDVVIDAVTCRGNARSGISVGGASRVEVRDSLLGDNGVAQMRTEGYSRASVEKCELLDNTAPAYLVAGGRLWIDGKEVHNGAIAPAVP